MRLITTLLGGLLLLTAWPATAASPCEAVFAIRFYMVEKEDEAPNPWPVTWQELAQRGLHNFSGALAVPGQPTYRCPDELDAYVGYAAEARERGFEPSRIKVEHYQVRLQESTTPRDPACPDPSTAEQWFSAAGPSPRPLPLTPEELRREGLLNYSRGLAMPGLPFSTCPQENRNFTTYIWAKAAKENLDDNVFIHNGTHYRLFGWTENRTDAIEFQDVVLPARGIRATQGEAGGRGIPGVSEVPWMVCAGLLSLLVRRRVNSR